MSRRAASDGALQEGIFDASPCHTFLRLGFVAVVGLRTTLPAAAQTGLATVTGIVTDTSGGAVPGVTVTATNQATNIAYTGVTNDVGNYVITGVPIGEYVVVVDLQGFKGARSTVTLSAAQTARVDFRMEVGSVEERLEVVATGAVLQTENAVVGIKVEREQIERLPAQGRNLSTATLYTAGVTSTNPNQFDSMRGGGRPAVNGQRIQGNNFTVDGVDSNEAHQQRHHSTSRARTRSSRSASRPTTTRPSSATWLAPSSTW